MGNENRNALETYQSLYLNMKTYTIVHSYHFNKELNRVYFDSERDQDS